MGLYDDTNLTESILETLLLGIRELSQKIE